MLDTALRDMGEGFVPQLLADPPENFFWKNVKFLAIFYSQLSRRVSLLVSATWAGISPGFYRLNRLRSNNRPLNWVFGLIVSSPLPVWWTSAATCELYK